MTEVDRHIFLKVLEYAAGHSEFTEPELSQATGFTSQDFQAVWQNVFTQAVGDNGQPINDAGGQPKFRITFGAFINYLDYVELNEARQSSNRAMRVAIGAIFISILLGFASIIVPLFVG